MAVATAFNLILLEYREDAPYEIRESKLLDQIKV